MHASGGRSCATFPRRNAICSWKMQADHSSEARQVLKAPEDRRLFLARAACAVGAMAGTASASQAAAPFSRFTDKCETDQCIFRDRRFRGLLEPTPSALHGTEKGCSSTMPQAEKRAESQGVHSSRANDRDQAVVRQERLPLNGLCRVGGRRRAHQVHAGPLPSAIRYHSGGRRKCSQRADAHAAPRRSVDVCSESAALTLSRTARGIG